MEIDICEEAASPPGGGGEGQRCRTNDIESLAVIFERGHRLACSSGDGSRTIVVVYMRVWAFVVFSAYCRRCDAPSRR